MTIKFSDITGGGIPYGDTAGRPANPGVGKLYSNGETARLELYTQDGSWENIVQEVPGVSSISGTYSEQSNSGEITIFGTNFVSGAVASAIGTNDIQIDADTTAFNSLVQVVATFTGLSAAYEPYDIKVTNPSNLFGLLPGSLYVNQTPVWNTSSGNIGTIYESGATGYSVQLSVTDPESNSLTYSISSGSLPTGLSLNSSTGVISGNAASVVSDTTYTFTVNVTDGINSSSRSFNLVRKAPVVTTFSYTGADQVFTVPSGLTSVICKIWGAGGGSGPTYQNGGGGGFTTGTLTIPSGTSSYRIVVGESYGYAAKSALGYGGAGYRTSANGTSGANGGGFSGIFTNNGSVVTYDASGQARAIAIAGGGGGTGYDNQAYGGAGGGASGGTGMGAGTYTPATGGTQSAGGSGNSGSNGAQLSGGTSTNGNNGGGGGGYWGGGASNGGSSDPGGGGGSGYVGGNGLHLFTGSTTIGENGISGPKNPGGTSDPYWNGTAGKGNQHGRVVLIY